MRHRTALRGLALLAPEIDSWRAALAGDPSLQAAADAKFEAFVEQLWRDEPASPDQGTSVASATELPVRAVGGER